jgi:hypothetical protein
MTTAPLTPAAAVAVAEGLTARYARAAAIAAILVAAAWHVANNLTGTLAFWSQYSLPSVAVLSWLVIALVTFVAASAMLSGLRLPGVVVAGGVAALLGCGCAVLMVTSRATFGLGDWAWNSVGWSAILLLWRARPRVLVGVLILNVAVSFATLASARTLTRLDISRFGLVAYGSSAIQLALLFGCRMLERTAGRAANASAERSEVATALLAAERVHADRQRRYRETGEVVRDLLAGLAQGNLDPTDRAVQHRCAVEASRLRRLIAEHDDVPSRLVHELRACADVAERRGVAVSLETVGSAPEISTRVRRALTEAPIHLLAGARSWARVTVFAPPEGGEVEVSVVADADVAPATGEGTEEVDEVAVIWAQEGETQWVRTRWQQPERALESDR